MYRVFIPPLVQVSAEKELYHWTPGPKNRRHRHWRIAASSPSKGERTWLRGRRRRPAMLLALWAASILVQRGPWTGYVLYNYVFAATPEARIYDWRPSYQTFLVWLVYHRIAVKVGPGLYAAHPEACEFARIPNRHRVKLIAELIMRREFER